MGLIQSAVGGTHIEAWLDNTTLPKCNNISDPGIAHNLCVPCYVLPSV